MFRGYGCPMSSAAPKLPLAPIAADFPNLPAPNDETIKLPPTGAVLHRRRLPLSPFWVHYSLDAEGIVVQQVLVPLE